MMTEQPSVTDIVRNVVGEVEKEYGKHVNFLWGDWTYIANQLTMMSATPQIAEEKYPVFCLFLPFDEDKSDYRYESSTNVDLLIATTTLSRYTNEERERESFKAVLRPLYALFIKHLKKYPLLDFERNHVPHTYSENYGYGARGVLMSEGKKFNDLIDGIDIKNLNLKIKKLKCYGRL